MSNQILKQNIESLNKQLKWLERSFNICKSIGIKDSYRETELDNFETLSGRFARSIDFLVRKVFRSLDDIEFEPQGTLIDTVNNAHKRNLINDINIFNSIRDLRNEIVHEYLEENLIDNFDELLKLTPELIDVINKTIKYANRYISNE
ncbi:MAG: hypothetical protein KatS3mg036_0921 [Ignavibacterium sp.]|uniref:hypothetical protein n=1 Tax=Ignavibacterium sp. TaxID=2651167 RepID=UPI0021DC07B4|nr:hypothetical protein [Ignavibacterium sp.]BDQ02001.1 MAG: hypothetical protein KatS3mg037_0576 [Ignavibacterium sp.]GIV46103.1 MAG: hypothetical protein KatS3mg036_0921 [Ignavibacterium sp.]